MIFLCDIICWNLSVVDNLEVWWSWTGFFLSKALYIKYGNKHTSLIKNCPHNSEGLVSIPWQHSQMKKHSMFNTRQYVVIGFLFHCTHGVSCFVQYTFSACRVYNLWTWIKGEASFFAQYLKKNIKGNPNIKTRTDSV